MANDYIFMTDDSCDLPREYLEKNEIEVLQLSYTIDGVTYKAYDKPAKEFYALLRAGKTSATAQVNVGDVKQMAQPFLAAGKDVLYLAFSSGLSGTCQSGMIAAEELSQEYPDRKFVVVDTLCASLGQGLLVHKANEMRKAGAALQEVADWVTQNRLHVAHYVMADDLMHLHRGGRVSKTSAIAGSLLGIKPIIHMNDEGKLISIDKIRGKKQALTAVVDKMEKCVGNTKNDIFMICNADCEEDAKFVAELASKRFGISKYLINFIGPVIGSHTGPGTIALFLMAEHR